MKRNMMKFSPERANFLDKIICFCGFSTVKQKNFEHAHERLSSTPGTGMLRPGQITWLAGAAGKALSSNTTNVKKVKEEKKETRLI
jgi:hypothetical protein